MLLSEPSAGTIASGLFVWWFPGNCRAVYHKVFIMPCATSVQVINGVGCFGSRCHEHYFWDHGSLIEKSRKESYAQYRCFEFFNRSKIWRCCRFACQILNPELHSCMITLILDIAVLRLLRDLAMRSFIGYWNSLPLQSELCLLMLPTYPFRSHNLARRSRDPEKTLRRLHIPV